MRLLFDGAYYMEIKTERLLLCPVTREHRLSTFAYAGDRDSNRYMMFLPYDSMEETAAAIDDAIAQWHSEFPERLEFAIISEAGHIGGITLYYLEDRTNGELGWVMHRDHWGRGYITEAALALMDYAAKDLGIRRMIACCDSENNASRRVMEKLGMKYCSTGKRKNRSTGDKERIELIYEISL